MPTISTADRFLGSLLGAYIGQYYSVSDRGHWPPVSRSSLYRSWLSSIQHLNVPAPKSLDTSLTAALPWLLCCHDDSARRHHWLSQRLASATIATPTPINAATETLYILGDCLEWLMQCTPDTQHPHPLLREHLQKRSVTYPAAIIPQVNLLIENLNAEALSTFAQVTDRAHRLSPITLALSHCLGYPENLALALANQPDDPCTAAIIGCLIGAWGGSLVIPARWIMALTQDSRQSLHQIAQRLYFSWAGINTTTTSFEAFSLDF